METHELVYMNRKTRETYGFNSLEEARGKMCYEVIQHSAAPCVLCNNPQLEEGEFKEWKYYNPILDKHLMLKDTVIEQDGKRYRVELALDVSDEEKQGSLLQSYENMEAFINEGLRITLQAPTPDQSLEIILEYLGKALSGERTYIFERNRFGNDDNTHEWVANGVKPEKDNLQNVPSEVCENWYRNFSENKNIIIGDLEEIREADPLQYENLKQQDISSLVVVPLYDEQKVIGFYGVDNPPVKSLDYTSNMLQIMGHFIVSTLRRRNLVRELEQMSYSDQLTKLGNRFAMERYVAEVPRGASFGVVYCDITGLKKVNDTLGHQAGDQLILRAAEVLREEFSDYGLFRIGGDELLALCAGIDEAELQQRVDNMKADMEQKDVVMAVGTVWQKDWNLGPDILLTESKSRMYEEKAAYYKHNGIDRRH
ncbi:MAG TPA: GGDEF domain-containing protein [Roseburia sp.]|nr:GGDEF domain-containing protein [Roseburia sp.]